MTEFGYALSSEEHGAPDLVANARAAEEAGFSFALISDHFHPWIDRQGETIPGGVHPGDERIAANSSESSGSAPPEGPDRREAGLDR